MDDNKVIPLMEAFFSKQFSAVDENDEAAKRTFSNSLRKPLAQFVEWYEAIRKDKTIEKEVVTTDSEGKKHKTIEKTVEPWVIGVDPHTQFEQFRNLPETTGIKELAKYEAEMIPILRDFSKRNCKSGYIEEFFDSYIERGKYGWNKRIQDLVKKQSG